MKRGSHCLLRHGRLYREGRIDSNGQLCQASHGKLLPMKKVSGRWKHLIICPDRGLFHGLTAILAEVTPGSSFVDLKAYPARRALTEAVNKEQPNLCFLDVGSSWDSAVSTIADLNGVNPAM